MELARPRHLLVTNVCLVRSTINNGIFLTTVSLNDWFEIYKQNNILQSFRASNIVIGCYDALLLECKFNVHVL